MSGNSPLDGRMASSDTNSSGMMGESVAEIAANLTDAQRQELMHYQPGEGYMPPANARRAYRLWLGICPGRRVEPLFLLVRAHGQCLYQLTPMGVAIQSSLSRSIP